MTELLMNTYMKRVNFCSLIIYSDDKSHIHHVLAFGCLRHL